MAQTILLKRSALQGKTPDTGSLQLGEVAINTYDGKAFIKRSGSIESIQEFILTNTLNTGSISLLGSQSITGSLNVSSGITGSLFGTSSYANLAATASFAQNFNPSATASYAITASYADLATTASFAQNFNPSATASFAISASQAISSSFALQALTASYFVTSSVTSASYANNATSASQATTSSYANDATSASYAVSASYLIGQSPTASYALTASYADDFTVAGTLTAQKIVVQTITSSVDYVTGSTIFGSELSNTHQFTGSVTVTGSLAVNNIAVITTNQTSSMSVLSASYALNADTASYVLNAVSSSYALSSSYAYNADFLDGKNSSEFAITGSNTFVGKETISGSIRLAVSADPDPTGVENTTYLFASSSNTSLGQDLYIRQDGNVTKWKWTEGQLASGLLYGGIVTWSGSVVYVSSGSGIIVNYNAVTGSEIAPIIDYVTWGPITSSITNITSSQVTYLYIDGNGALQQQPQLFTPEQFQQYIPLGAVGHFDYANISAFGGDVNTAYGQQTQTNVFIDAFGPMKLNGYVLEPQTSTLHLNIGSGTSFIHGGFYEQNQNDPSTFSSNSQITASIVRCYTSGSETVFLDNTGSFFTTVDPTKWDNNGVLNTVNSANWSIQRVFSYPQTNTLYIYYGQSEYTTFTNALQYLASDPFVEGLATQPFTIFVGYLILKGNTTNIADTNNNRIIQAGLYRSTVGGSTGGSAVTTTLEDLADVTITSPVTGEALIYNAGIWVNSYPTTSSYANDATSASYAFAATSASYAVSASHAPSALTASYAISASQAITASYANNATSASYAFNSTSGSYATQALTASYANVATSASYASFASQAATASYFITSSVTSASYASFAAQAATASYVENAQTASYVLNAVSSSFAENVKLPIEVGNSAIDVLNEKVFLSSIGGEGIQMLTQGGSLIYDNEGILNLPAIVSGGYDSSAWIRGGGGLRIQSGEAIWKFYQSSPGYSQIEFPDLTYQYTAFPGFPSGLVSSSQQITNLGFAITGSNTFTDNQIISGTLIVTNGITGSLFGTASYALNATNALTASYFVTSSVTSASFADSSSYSLSASFAAQALTASYANNATSASYANIATSASYSNIATSASYAFAATSASYALSSSYALSALTASYAISASQAISASYANTATSASYANDATSASYAFNATSASYAQVATSASHAPNAVSSSYAQTSSYANNFTVAGTLTAQTINVQTITSSIDYVTGSTVFGSELSNTHQFTGSVTITGSLAVNGSNVVLTNQTSSMTVLSSSYALTASYAGVATSASYALTATSSSFAPTAASASYATTSSYASNFIIDNTLILDGTLIDYATVNSSISGPNNLFTRSTGSYRGAFYKYTLYNGTNARSGEVMAVWNDGNTQYTDVSTVDLGSTSAVTASVSIISAQAQFNFQTNTSGWTIKSTVTYI